MWLIWSGVRFTDSSLYPSVEVDDRDFELALHGSRTSPSERTTWNASLTVVALGSCDAGVCTGTTVAWRPGALDEKPEPYLLHHQSPGPGVVSCGTARKPPKRR